MVLEVVLSNVPIGLANTLSSVMLVLVAILLLSGPAMVWYFWKQNKKLKAAQPTTGAAQPEPSQPAH